MRKDKESKLLERLGDTKKSGAQICPVTFRATPSKKSKKGK